MMDDLLSHTDSLFNHVFWFKNEFDLLPQKEHHGSAIDITDISERKHDFLSELINTVTSWVYSNSKIDQLVTERLETVNGDRGNAYTFLTTKAFSKFRPNHPQGQFGELLLFNFIQHFFEAVPLLRKQPITTSVGHERFGADAIHYKKSGESNVMLLGESKCYKSKYSFATAFKKSLNSIISSFNDLSEEMDLYTYDDFIDPDLEEVAKKYKANNLPNVHFELVCLVAYNESMAKDGDNEEEIKNSIQGIIEERCSNLSNDCFSEVEANLLNRMNYIVFPIWELDTLLDDFNTKVRVK